MDLNIKESIYSKRQIWKTSFNMQELFYSTHLHPPHPPILVRPKLLKQLVMPFHSMTKDQKSVSSVYNEWYGLEYYAKTIAGGSHLIYTWFICVLDIVQLCLYIVYYYTKHCLDMKDRLSHQCLFHAIHCLDIFQHKCQQCLDRNIWLSHHCIFQS